VGHNHNHGSKNILLAFFLNASFAVIELIGGYLTNSVAIYSDALHDFGDSLSLLLSYFAEKFSHKKADDKYTFGYRRFSILSAVINGGILLTGSLFVIYEAIKRIITPEPVVPEGMLALAILGIVVNSFAAYRISLDEGMNAKMVMYHLLEDLLGWIAVFVVSIVLLYKPWFILDSILSILVSLIVLRGVYKNLIKIGFILLQKFPDELELKKLKETLENYSLILGIHAVRGWSIDDSSYYLSFHVKVSPETTIAELDKLKLKMKETLISYKVKYSTIEFEADTCSNI
jgi:cobalt-zinc-cadmium efflux system protein